jgi:hypothetical protein
VNNVGGVCDVHRQPIGVAPRQKSLNTGVGRASDGLEVELHHIVCAKRQRYEDFGDLPFLDRALFGNRDFA